MTKSRLSLGYGPSTETGQETLARPGGAPNIRLVGFSPWDSAEFWDGAEVQGLCKKGRGEASAILWYIGNSPAVERGSIISNKQLPSFSVHGLDFELRGEEAKELSSESLMSRTFRTEKSETFQALNQKLTKKMLKTGTIQKWSDS